MPLVMPADADKAEVRTMAVERVKALSDNYRDMMYAYISDFWGWEKSERMAWYEGHQPVLVTPALTVETWLEAEADAELGAALSMMFGVNSVVELLSPYWAKLWAIWPDNERRKMKEMVSG